MKSSPPRDEAVLERLHRNTLTLTINRPNTRNALDRAATIALGDALDRAHANPVVRVVVITGAGDQAFCAGADLKALAAGEPILPDDPAKAARGFGGIVRHAIDKPLIAAVNGSALGGGTEIVLACDLAIAAETASFGLPEVRRGLVAAAGGAFRLAAHLPHKWAMELLLTGDAIPARRALALGLVNAVCRPDELMATATALAERIAGNAPLAVQASKRIAKQLDGGTVGVEAAAWTLSDAETRRLSRSADAREGARAFAEKRPPVWQAN